MKNVKDYIRTIPDFPHEGIMFRDVTTLFADPSGLRLAIDQLLQPYAGVPVDKIVGLEARGFILGGAIAYELGKGFVPIRKQGKLPGATLSQAYTLEYGEAVMEIHEDAIEPGEKVWWLMIFWPQAERRLQVSSCWSVSAPMSSDAHLSSIYPISAAGVCWRVWICRFTASAPMRAFSPPLFSHVGQSGSRRKAHGCASALRFANNSAPHLHI